MALRRITAHDLTSLDWIEIPRSELTRVDWKNSDADWWRIVAEITCTSCGAFQAVDSDPTNDKSVATQLALSLFHNAGWRADARDRAVCGDCVRKDGNDG